MGCTLRVYFLYSEIEIQDGLGVVQKDLVFGVDFHPLRFQLPYAL